MTFGKVHKKKSTWWYSKQSDNSDLILSTKHRTQGDAWKAASEEMYKAQQEAQGGGAGPQPGADTEAEAPKEGDDVQDVDFEEVNEEEK